MLCCKLKAKFTALLFIFSVVLLQAQNLEQAVNLALKNNAQLKAQHENVVRAKTEAKAAFRGTLPEVNFAASYSHVTDVPEITMASPLGSQTIRLGTFDKYESGLTMNYVAFSGFAQQSSIRMKEIQKDLALVQLGSGEKDIVFKTIQAYRQVQSLQLTVQIYNAAQKRVALKLQDVRSLVKQGMALSLDTLSLNLALLDVQQNILSVQSKLDLAKQLLNNLTGSKISVIRSSAEFIPDVISLWDASLDSRLQALDKQIQLTKTSSDLLKSAFYPNLVLFASYKYGKPGLDMISNDWMTYGVWGAGLSWNIFSWQKDDLKLQAARANTRRLIYQKQSVEDQLKLGFDQTKSAFIYLTRGWQVQQKAVKLANLKMETVQSRYSQGMASATDFNLANLELTQAELKEAQQRIQILLKINELDFKSGKSISEWSLIQ